MSKHLHKIGTAFMSVLLASVLVACGSDGSADTSAEPDTTEKTDTSSAPEAAEKVGFTMAMTTPGIGNAPLLAALDAMRADGYDIEAPILADVSLAIEGLFRGQFQFSSGSTSAALLAMAQDAPLALIGDRSGNEWTLVTDADIEECADLDGVQLAWHATNGSASVMTRSYIEQECPGTEPVYSVLQGSSNRATAMVAGRVDATPLELADVVALQASDAIEVNLLTSFGKALPGVRPAAIYGNTDFMKENPQAAIDLLAAVIEQNRKVNEDPDYLVEIATKYLPDYDPATIAAAAPLYVELGVFDNDGGLTEADLQATLEFFQATEPDLAALTADDIGDLTYIDKALERVGRA